MNDRAVNVLERYDIEVLRTAKGRGALLCEAKQGYFILKNYAGLKEKLAFQDMVLKRTAETGDICTEQIVPSKDGELCVTDQDHTSYILKTYFNGKECNIRDMDECAAAMKTLARLHQEMSIPADESSGIHSVYRIDYEYEKHNRELKKVRKYLRTKSQKSEFELFLLAHIDGFLELALRVTEELKSYGVEKDCAFTLEQGYISHGDYQYHNILNQGAGMAVVNFEKCIRDNPVRDVYLFLRKLLEKNNWSKSIGDRMLEAYQKQRPLTAHDCIQLYYRFAYPEKFWKIVNFYFNSGKAWIPDKNKEKLQKLLQGEKNKQEFLDSIFPFIS